MWQDVQNRTNTICLNRLTTLLGDIKYEFLLNGIYLYQYSLLFYNGSDGNSLLWKWEVIPLNTFRVYNNHPELVSLSQHEHFSTITIFNNTDLELYSLYGTGWKNIVHFKRSRKFFRICFFKF